MSVINQVLLELEKRRASGAERGVLPDHVRAIPDNGHDNGSWLTHVAIAVMVVVLVVAWFAREGVPFLRSSSVSAPLPQETVAVIEKVVSASAAGTTDVRPREDESESPDGTARPVARLSFELANPPVRSAPEAQQDAPRRAPIPTARVTQRAEAERSAADAAPASPAPRIEKEPAKEPTAVAPTKAPAAGVAKGEIEKQVRQPTARELSDGEYRKAAALLQQGRLAEALETFRAAVNLYPANHAARQAMVALLLEGKHYPEAERALQEGVKLAPEQTGFAMTFARLQVDRGDTAAAITTLRSSLAHAQSSADYVAFLAALLQRQGKHDEAIEQYQVALRLKPGTGLWWLGLGISLQATQHGPDAQEAFRRAKAANNLSPELAAFADQRLRQLQ